MYRAWQIGSAMSRVIATYLWRRDDLLDVVARECQTLGGVYVKFLQQLLTTDALRAVRTNYLHVYDHVETEPIPVWAILRDELGDKYSELCLVDDTPFASGSFAQVYRAMLGDIEVVIKVLRPSVMRTLVIDLAAVRIISWCAKWIVNDMIDLSSFAREFAKATRQETDYHREVRMAAYMAEYFGARADIVIPKTLAALSTRRIIVQEYIDGLSLVDVIAAHERGEDGVAFANRSTGSQLDIQLTLLGREFLTATLQADYIMSDPHLGNIMLLPNNKVGLIDFGLVASAPRHRSAFFGMIQQYRALYEGQVDAATLSIAMIAFYDYELYEALITVTRSQETLGGVHKYIRQALLADNLPVAQLSAERKMTRLFFSEINADNRFGLRISEHDIILQKAMFSYLATVRAVSGEQYNTIIREALRQTEHMAMRTGVRESSLHPRSTMSLERAQEIMIDWLSHVAERDQAAYRFITERSLA